MKNPTGLVVFDGLSRINKQPIIAVATLRSDNTKLGDMVNVWILNKKCSPSLSIHTGMDYAVCGDCELRGHITTGDYNSQGGHVGIIHKQTRNTRRTCYVVQHWAPTNIFKKFEEGGYPKLTGKTEYLLKNRPIRFGSSGDPAAIPLKTWEKLLGLCLGHTSYTRQWKFPKNRSFNTFCQASVFSVEEAKKAQAKGFRTFRVSKTGQPVRDVSGKSLNEMVCPASLSEKMQCNRCLICNGQYRNVVIKVHGSRAKIAAFNLH